jgi:hypothetical protein
LNVRTIGLIAGGTLCLGLLVDGGSVMLTRISVTDDARNAGYNAAAAAQNLPTTRQTALIAFEAAQETAKEKGLTVSTEDFTLYPDGRVRLTTGRAAPTLLLHRVDSLRHLGEVEATVTVDALPYS